MTNRAQQVKLIRDLETNIVANRKRLVEIDERLAAIATQHLSPVPGSTEQPYEIAKRIIEERPRFAWITDRPDRPFNQTGISSAEVDALASARISAISAFAVR